MPTTIEYTGATPESPEQKASTVWLQFHYSFNKNPIWKLPAALISKTKAGLDLTGSLDGFLLNECDVGELRAVSLDPVESLDFYESSVICWEQ